MGYFASNSAHFIRLAMRAFWNGLGFSLCTNSCARRSAIERAAYLVAFLYQRAAAVGLIEQKSLLIPITQQHVADTLGLSIVHTNKTLRKLSEKKLIRWHDRACEVLDPPGLLDVAGWTGLLEGKRPLI